ncbi:MAG: flagellar hook protein FlgE [Desulfovibrionaceae bacterium]
MSFESLYIGATGMISHGTAMNNIGNNIANVNTVAYKSSSTLFANLFSESVVTGSGTAQSGLGVSVADIVTNYNLGTITETEDVLDLAISGKGYFQVEQNGDTLYTRAGNFRFDSDGKLVNPNGYVLQGKEITEGSLSVTKDVQLNLGDDGTITMPAQATSAMTLISNLGTYADATTSSTNPYFSLLETWDGTSDTPLGDGAYSFSQNITVYDENGTAQTLTVYYDGAESEGGTTIWEYLVTMDPADDGRYSTSNAGAGLLMAGTLTFSSAGELRDMTAYTLNADAADDATQALSNWSLASFDANGLPVFSATFAADDGAVTDTIGLNFGISSSTGTWSIADGGDTTAATTYGSNASLPSMDGVTIDDLVSTAYSGTASTTISSQDGWTEGQLSSLTIDSAGVMSGNYTNGESQELYQLTLYVFTNEYGLSSEGSNLYRATAESGEAIEGLPEEGARGSIESSALENSNVDLAKEFVSMITTQRGFQANSKVITTSDEMLRKAMELKR